MTDDRQGTEQLRCDLVLLGTGYDSRMPALVRDLAASRASPRSRSAALPGRPGRAAGGALYLQGVNEATHGIADSLISVLAHRARDISGELLARHTALPDQGSR